METYLSELKRLVLLHARSQGIPCQVCHSVLSQIKRDEDGDDGWADAWMAKGDHLLASGEAWQAIQCYNLGRFPYINTERRHQAHRRCIDTFATWVKTSGEQIQRIEIPFKGERISFYFSAAQAKYPLLFVIGGIVSIKEQWARFLLAGPRLGFCTVVAEFPGVGENSLAYQHDAHHMIGAIIDRLSDRAAVEQTYVVGMSFGGHLAIQQALIDPRICGIVTIGAPLHYFYQDAEWWKGIPQTTKRTLAHLCRTDLQGLFERIQPLRLADVQMRRLAIPIDYIASLRDEIIPPAERNFLRSHIAKLRLYEFDDVHGCPHYMEEIQDRVPLSLLRQSSRGTAPIAIYLKTAMMFRALKRGIETLSFKRGVTVG